MGPYDHLTGIELARIKASWDEERVMLYAVAVGAGLDDPARSLEFTTENTPGHPLQVLPTFLAQVDSRFHWLEQMGWGTDPTDLRSVHGEHAVTLVRPLPARGTAEVTVKLDGVYDKGSGALVVSTCHIALESGEYLGSSTLSAFVQGRGGFGGPRDVPGAPPPIDTSVKPDLVVSLPSAVNQSLLFRLMGDRTRHGTHQAFAELDGFERPILFGLCTFGYAGRALLRGLCDEDVSRFGHIEGRFSKPVYPGDQLDTLIWRTDEGARFQVIAGGERVAFDRGLFRYAGA